MTSAASRAAGPSWHRWVLVLGVGLATGIVTQIGQSLLPAGWSQAANAISPWLLVSFLAGSSMPGRMSAIAAGTAILLLALVGYYATTQMRYGIGGGTGSLVLWGISAVLGGPVFGSAGRMWRTGPPTARSIALGLLAAVAIAEGIYHALVLDEPPVGAGFVVVGLLVPLLLGRTQAVRIGAYAATVPAIALGGLGYVALMWFNTLTAGL